MSKYDEIDEWGDPVEYPEPVEPQFDTEEQKLALERELVNEGKIYPRAHYMPRGRARGVIACLLAFFFGMFVILGALVGAGIWLGSTKIKNWFPNGDKFLTETYLDQSALDLIRDVMKDINEFNGINSFTLESLAKYSPIIEDTVESLTKQFSENYGLELDRAELISQPFSGFGAYLSNILQSVELGRMFHKMSGDSFDTNKLVLTLCYGEANVDYQTDEEGKPVRDENGNVVMLGDSKPTTLGDFISEGVTGKVESLTLGDIVDINDNSSQLFRSLKDKTIRELKDEESIRSMKIGEVIDTAKATGLLHSISDWSISDLSNGKRIERLRIQDVISSKNSHLMQAIADWRISDLSNEQKIDSLTLGDVIDLEGKTGILKALSDAPLSDLQAEIDALPLTDILSGEAFENNRILSNLKNSTIGTLSYDIKHLTVEQVFGNTAFSYMEVFYVTNPETNDKSYEQNEDGTLQRVDYNFLFDGYFGTESEDGDFNYIQESYNKTGENNFVWRPTALADVTSNPTFRTYYTVLTEAGDVQVEAGYYYPGTHERYKGVNPVLFDAAINRANNTQTTDDEGNSDDPAWKTPYFYEQIVRLSPVKEYYVLDLDNSAPAEGEPAKTKGLLAEGDRVGESTGEPAEGATGLSYFTADGKEFLIYEDKVGLYFDRVTVAKDGENQSTERIYLDYDVTGYLLTDANGELLYDEDDNPIVGVTRTDGKWVDSAGNVVSLRTMKATVDKETGETTDAYDYYVYRAPLDRLYYAEDGTLFDERDGVEITERYSYTKTLEENTVDIELDRYLSGVWYLLLNNRQDTPLLEMDGLVSNVSGTMQDTLLANLWFNNMLADNPYVEFTFLQNQLVQDVMKEKYHVDEPAGLLIYVPLTEGNQRVPWSSEYDGQDGYENKNGYVYVAKYVHNLIQVALGDTIALMQEMNKVLVEAIP